MIARGPWAQSESDRLRVVRKTGRYCYNTIAVCGTETNARLIASAPDIYAALKMVIPTLEQILKDDPLNFAAKNNIKYARAALEKAEGREL